MNEVMVGKRLPNLLRHIENVRDDCLLLGQRLIERGDEHIGMKLIANGQIHDNSKFYGIEFEHLNDGAWPRPDDDPNKELFLAALKQHVTTNKHHPEYWGTIDKMPPLYICEMCCDWKSRSNEQGTNLMDYVRGRATDRFGFSRRSAVYRTIKEFVELLLERKMV